MYYQGITVPYKPAYNADKKNVSSILKFQKKIKICVIPGIKINTEKVPISRILYQS